MMRKQYEQGKFCDVIVRCVVLPEQELQEQEQEEQSSNNSSSSINRRKRSAMTTEAPRRSRRRGSNSQQQLQVHDEMQNKEDEHESANQATPLMSVPQPRTTDILCHAIVLCACSPYFESSLGGEWNEAQTKTVEVVLENDQAVEDMKLLIKLCYSGSYTNDGEKLIDRTTRMRLAFLGNAFEIKSCVWECLRSPIDDLNPTNALTTLDDVPEELRGHEAMARVTVKIIEILAVMIDEWTPSDPPAATDKETKQKIVTPLASALGPVHRLFGESSCLNFHVATFYAYLPLKPHVLALPLTVMEELLASDALHLTTENELYTLLLDPTNDDRQQQRLQWA